MALCAVLLFAYKRIDQSEISAPKKFLYQLQSCTNTTLRLSVFVSKTNRNFPTGHRL